MAEVVFTARERNQIAAVLAELRATVDQFFCDVRPHLSPGEWALLSGYATACVRRVLEVGTSLHAVADAHESSFPPYAGRGRDPFVGAALLAWTDSYAPIDEVWRIAPIFERIPGGEKRLRADLATLETMAANRLFTCLDEQCERFLASGGESGNRS